MTVFNDTYDTDTPAGSDDPAEADDRMREIKDAVQQRENVDHYWPLTGTEVSDADAGEQRKLTMRTLSVGEVAALSATKAYLYRLVTDGELYFKDASNNTIKLTSGGNLLSASLDMKDEDDMSSDSATHAATQQSIKAFAEAEAAAAAAAVDSADDFTPTLMTGANDSIGTVTCPNGLIMKWGKATVSGGGGTITFAVAFPNACFQVIICGGHASSGTTHSIMSHTITASNFGWESGSGAQVTPARWFAIGR